LFQKLLNSDTYSNCTPAVNTPSLHCNLLVAPSCNSHDHYLHCANLTSGQAVFRLLEIVSSGVLKWKHQGEKS